MSLETSLSSERGQIAHTYESLAQSVESLKEQLQHLQATAESLQHINSIGQLLQLFDGETQSRAKFEELSQIFSELRRSQPNSPLDFQISSEMESTLSALKMKLHAFEDFKQKAKDTEKMKKEREFLRKRWKLWIFSERHSMTLCHKG
jgi:uncharacterized coiled-coil DUF342 family protein